jgi:CDGSH-type Zn-finger protein/uncharacterized Fe-S cluster protein YjdI
VTPAVRPRSTPTREQLIHLLAEAAELEHNLMCTYLYAAFSLKREDTTFSAEEAEAVARWRKTIVAVAVEEMGHLAAVWNITAALGGAPQLGRGNFPLEPGGLPAGLVIRLAPFGEASLQHFIHLERPAGSDEAEGTGFESGLSFRRTPRRVGLVPTSLDYETVGEFYVFLEAQIAEFAELVGEKVAFAGDPALQLSPAEVELPGAAPVLCRKTALAALTAIVEQGEGAPLHSTGSHFARFAAIRDELRALVAKNPTFQPAYPAAVNPVLRPPLSATGRVWIEDERAFAAVDLANSAYALMLRLLALSYLIPRPRAEKALAIDLSRGLMRVISVFGERAATLPAGPSSPGCHAGMSFTALRGAVAVPADVTAPHFFAERFSALARAAAEIESSAEGRSGMGTWLTEASERARHGFANLTAGVARQAANPGVSAATSAPPTEPGPPPATKVAPGVEEIEGKRLTLVYEGRKCIHSRFCVTWGPRVFLANVEGPWIHPDAMDAESVVEIAHACPSGAIRYRRKDGKPDESAPPVNLLSVREGGPYALRADLAVGGQAAGYRATLCRCGASKHKPYCDGSHKEIGFAASGEPPTGATTMLEARDGPLAVEPQPDGPLQVRGNLEIVSGTGRVVSRVTSARLCRCGGSANKPFCDGTHERIGFRSS